MDFDAIYAKHYDSLLALAKRYLKNKEDAEEAVHDAFIKLIDSWDSYDSSRPMSSWLNQICRNTAKDILRKRNRSSVEKADPDSIYQLFYGSKLSEDPPEALLIASLTMKEAESVLSSLPDEVKAVVSMALVDNLTYNQISCRTGVPVNTVKTWVRRTRDRVSANLIKNSL